MKDQEDSPWFFLFGGRVDALSRDPETFFGGVFQHPREADKCRAGANVLALQSGYVLEHEQPAFPLVQEDQRPPVFVTLFRPVELNGGIQTVLFVVFNGTRYEGPAYVLVVQGRRVPASAPELWWLRGPGP